MRKPECAWFATGETLFVVRFAIRSARLERHSKRDRGNRLVARVTADTRYYIDRYDYCVVYWPETKADPQIVSTHAEPALAAQALEAEIVERA